MFVSSLLGDGVKISSDVLDPFAGRLSSFLADSLLLSSSLLAELFLSSLTSLLVGLSSLLSDLSTSGDKSVVGLVVGQGVGDLESVENSVSLGGSDGALDLVGVDDSGNIGVGDLIGGEGPALLLRASLSEGSEDVVELLEGAFGPDNESADVSSGGQLEEVESADVRDFNTGDVSESLDQGHIGTAVDDQRSSSASVSSSSGLSASSSNSGGVNNFLNISPSSDVLQESDGFLGSFDLLGGVRHNQGEFGDGVNSVSSGLDKREDG